MLNQKKTLFDIRKIPAELTRAQELHDAFRSTRTNT